MIARAGLLAAVAVLLVASPVAADGHVTPGDGQLNVVVEQGHPGLVGSTSTQSDQTTVSELTSCDLNEVCSEMICEPSPDSPLGGHYVYYDGDALPLNLGWCDIAEDAPVVITPGLALQALRRITLPGSELVVQPPGGRTLVNFETNFYTRNGEFTRTVSLLGQRVELRIWPAAYGWRFGDGATRRTAGAGSPYPDLEITHRYLAKGRVAPRVDTTYAAEFRVNGGAWRDVGGTVTIPGAREGLRVVEARPVLVGD